MLRQSIVRRAVTLLCAVGFASAAVSVSQRAAPEAAVAAAREILAGAPGVSVAVVERGAVRWREAFGVADPATGRAATVDTRFLVWSVAKAWTATAAAHLAEQGRLDPSAPASQYLPGLPEGLRAATIMQVATHRSGIRHYRDDAEAIHPGHCEHVADALPIFIDDPLVAAPGSGEHYSTWGYVLLSAVIERACGTPFATCMRDTVLEPAGMTGVRAVWQDGCPDCAVGAERVNDEFRPVPGLDASCKFGGGGFVATPLDLARFYDALLGGRLVGPPMRELILGEVADGIVRTGGLSAGGRSAVRVDLSSGQVVAIAASARADAIDFAALADRIAAAFR
jgi:serine beta-lactamase-like protein LACTB, mitochondrial